MALNEHQAAHARSLGRLMAQVASLNEYQPTTELKKKAVEFINQELELSSRGEG